MYCPRCGTPVAAGLSVCGACGGPAGAIPGAGASVTRPVLISVLAILQFTGAAVALTVALLCLAVVAAGDGAREATAGAVIFGALGGLELACGIGLWRLRPWGRALLLVFSWLGLLEIPIGTVISVLVLVYLFKPGVKVLFSGRRAEELTPDERAQIAAVAHGSHIVAIVIVLLVALAIIAVVGIVAAVAIPGLVRARAVASEAVAIGSLRAITSAEVTFSATCGGGFYAPSLARLAAAPSSGGATMGAFVSPDLATDPAVRGGYTILLTPGPAASSAPASCNGARAGTLVETYFISASPTGVPGGRYFGANQEGTIYTSAAAIPVTQTGPPAGATPVGQ